MFLPSSGSGEHSAENAIFLRSHERGAFSFCNSGEASQTAQHTESIGRGKVSSLDPAGKFGIVFKVSNYIHPVNQNQSSRLITT